MRRWRIWPRAKGVNATYVSRVLRLTLLAPEIVEAILDGRQPAELQLDDLLEGFPLDWEGQRSGLGGLGELGARTARGPSVGWAAAYVTDRDSFIQKAVGWWLRSLSAHDPDRVRASSRPGAGLSAFARREALRRL